VSKGSTANAGGEGRDSCSQQIHPRVVLGQHRQGRHRVAHLFGRSCRGSGQFSHPAPQPARGPELGDGGELFRGGGIAKFQQTEGVLDRAATVLQLAQVFGADCQCVSQFARVARTRLMRRRAIDDQRSDAQVVGQFGDG
jgi:hypothetical protein